MADWRGVPADNVADINMVGGSSREWANRQTADALDAGTAVATSSQHIEPHQVGAMLQSVTPVLHVDFVETCGSKDALHASLVVLNNHYIMHDTTAYPSTDTSDGIRGGGMLFMVNCAFQHKWLDHCLASRASHCSII